MGDGGARKVEGAIVGGGDDFDRAGIINVVRRAADGQRRDLHFGALEKLEHRREVVGGEKRFVALDVDVDVSGDGLGDRPDAIGAAGAVLRREASEPGQS